MALTLDATVGGADANSYADVAAAEAVAAYRVGGSAAAWLALNADQKIQTLVTATRALDTLAFKGRRASATQALEWPRLGTAFTADELPAQVVAATIETAFEYARSIAAGATTDVLNPDTARIKREKVGPIETEFFTPATTVPEDLAGFPLVVQRLLAPLIWIAPVSGWGSAAVARSS